MFKRHEWLLLALMSAVQFGLIVDFMIVMPLGPQLMRIFGLSAQEFGFLVSVYTFGAGFMGIVASLYVDRVERKKGILLFLLGFFIGNLCCACAETYHQFLLARFITGAFGGVVGSLIYAIVCDEIEPERRSTALGVIMASFALASILGVPACLVLSNYFGWHSPFWAVSVFSVLLALVLWQKLSVGKWEAPAKGHRVWKQFSELVSGGQRPLAIFFMAFLILGHFSVNPFLFPSVVLNAEIAESRLPVVYLISGFASIFASVAFGKLADAFGAKRVFTLALFASLGALYWITNLQPGSLYFVALAVSTFFVFMGGRLTPAIAIISSTSELKNRAGFMSLIGSVQQLSAAFGAFVAGLLVTKATNGKLIHFDQVGFFAIAMSFLSLLCAWKITKRSA